MNIYNATQNAQSIHIHGPYNLPALVGIFVAQCSDVDLIIHTHGMISPLYRENVGLFKRFYEKLLLSNKFRWRALTNLEAKEIVNVFGDVRVDVISNCVNISEIDHLKTVYPIENIDFLTLSLMTGRKAIFFGRISSIKGVFELVTAWKKFESESDDWFLIFIGPFDSSILNIFLSAVRDNPSIKYFQPPEEKLKYAFLKMADVFILPSKAEGQSLALLEAMALSLPVIYTSVCQFNFKLKAQIGLNSTERLDGDSLSEFIYKSLITFSKTPKRDVEKLGAAGRLVCEKHYDVTKVGKMFLQTYNC